MSRLSRDLDNWNLGIPRVPLLVPWMPNGLFHSYAAYDLFMHATPDSNLMAGLDGMVDRSILLSKLAHRGGA